jgi:hypothetical protein
MHATDFMNLSALDLAPLQVPAKTKVCDRSNLLSVPRPDLAQTNPAALFASFTARAEECAFSVHPHCCLEYTKAPRVIYFLCGRHDLEGKISP